jgi:hypothetical protein
VRSFAQPTGEVVAILERISEIALGSLEWLSVTIETLPESDGPP